METKEVVPAAELYLTASRIAAITGKTVQGVHQMAKKGEWPYRSVNGRGLPRKEYLITSLPAEIQNLHLEKIRCQVSGVRCQGSGVQSSRFKVQGSKSEPFSLKKIITIPEETGKNPAMPEENGKDPWRGMPEACREAGFRLLAIVNRARDIHVRTKTGKTRALERYAKREGISPATLRRHMKKADSALDAAHKTGRDTVLAQVNALAYGYGKTRDQVRSFDRAAVEFAFSRYLTEKHLNISDIYEETRNTAIVEGWRIGSYETLARIIGKMDAATCARARRGNHHFEDKHLVKILRDYGEIWPNFMWCGDHHIFDVFVKIPNGKGSWTFLRPWITCWMDLATRSLMGWCISFNPNSQCIAMALAHGISHKNDPNFPQHGLPESVYIDNGKDYRSKYLRGEKVMIGGDGRIDYPDVIEKFAALGIDPFYIDLEYDSDQDAWVKKRGKKELAVKGVLVGGVYARLGINQRYATAYHPWAKPVERMFRTVVQSFSRQLPGWCGSGHENRPEKLKFELKRAAVLTLDEFCAAWHGWVINKYHKAAHRGHGMNGMAPDQAFESRLPQPQRVDANLLDFALMKKDKVRIYNWGFSLNGRKFEPKLPVNLYGGYLANNIIGQWAQVLFDADYKTVRLYKDGEYVCDAGPLERASWIEPDDPVMREKLRLQAYQKRATAGMMAGVGVQGSGFGVQGSGVRCQVSGVRYPERKEIEHIRPQTDAEIAAEVARIEDYTPKRPVFSSKVDRYQWCLSNPDGMTDEDREFAAGYEAGMDADTRTYWDIYRESVSG